MSPELQADSSLSEPPGKLNYGTNALIYKTETDLREHREQTCDCQGGRGMDWLDLLAVQGTLKSLLQHHSSKASILQRSAFFIVQFSHPYTTTGKTIALTRWTFVDKVMSLLFNMLSEKRSKSNFH